MSLDLETLLPKLQEFSGDILKSHADFGDLTIVVKKDRIVEILRHLRDDPSLKFEMLMDLAGVDGPTDEKKEGAAAERFEVVYHLYSLTHNHRVRVRAKVPESDLRIASVVPLWTGADWFERECFDMFGIRFEGHPNLKRLLLFEGFEGHPLRKDYPITRRQKIPVPEEVI